MANSAADRFDSLLSLMARLRSEGGCPWDREQTRASLQPYLLEEAYEVLSAIDEGSTEHLVEELGDLLFQVVFHCQIASEQGEFTMTDVIARLTDKMTRRHPHVFGDRVVSDARQALAQWERIKQDEGKADGQPRSVLDGVPDTLPALLRAQRLQVKAGRVGFDWPDAAGALEKVREELGEVTDALQRGDRATLRDEVGDLLFSVVNVARLADVDPEDALQSTVDRFSRRFASMEDVARREGRDLSNLSLDEWDRLWSRAKSLERPA